MRRDLAGEQARHTEVAGESSVKDGDPSETLPSTSDTGHFDDLSRYVPPVNSPDNSSVRSEGGDPNELSRVKSSEVHSLDNVGFQCLNLGEGSAEP